MEYNKSTFLRFYEGIRQCPIEKHHTFLDREIQHNLIKTVENIYKSNQMQALTNPLSPGNGILQGDLISPSHLNIFYASDNKESAQRYSRYSFLEKILKRRDHRPLNMTISIAKTKCMKQK